MQTCPRSPADERAAPPRTRYGWLREILKQPWPWWRKLAEAGWLGGESREPVLDGIRGIAILLVFLAHADRTFLWLREGVAGEWASLWFTNGVGHAGVELFFVLSGYLLYGYLVAEPRAYGPFLKRRIERLYPAFLAVFTLYLALSYARPDRSKIPPGWDGAGYLAANILLLPGIFDMRPMITVAWSLSYELLFYLIVPWVALSMRRWRPRARCWTLLGFALAYTAYSVTDRYREVHVGGLPLPPAAHMRLVMFVAGMLVYEWSRMEGVRARLTRGMEAAALAAAVLAAGFVYWTQEHPQALAAWLPGFGEFPDVYRVWALAAAAPGLFLCALWGGGLVGRVLRWPWLRWLGQQSYSFYLMHGLAMLAASEVLRRWLSPGLAAYWVAVAVVGLASGTVSTLLFALVEKPLSLAVHIKSARL